MKSLKPSPPKPRTGNPLKWQASTLTRPGEKSPTSQRKIQNTTFIYPAAGSRGIKRP